MKKTDFKFISRDGEYGTYLFEVVGESKEKLSKRYGEQIGEVSHMSFTINDGWCGVHIDTSPNGWKITTADDELTSFAQALVFDCFKEMKAKDKEGF